MSDQLLYQTGWQRAVQHHGVPMLLVHVPAGRDGRVLLAQGNGALWITLEIDARWVVIRHGDGEHFASDFVNKRLGTKGRALIGSRLAQALGNGIWQIHNRHVLNFFHP